MTERFARNAARHPWRRVTVWLAALLVSMVVIVTSLGDVLTGDAELTNDPESYRAYELMNERLPPDPNSFTEVVIVRSGTHVVDDPAFRQKVEAVVGRLEATGGVANVQTFYETDDRQFVSPDRDAILIPVPLRDEDSIGRIVDEIEAEDRGAFDVEITGEITFDEDESRLSDEDLRNGELFFGAPASLIVLLVVFGTVVAGLLPLLTAIISIIVALALSALVGQVWDLSIYLVNMLGGMGLALGIDYTLFVLSRFREERVAGREELDAIAKASSTASRAVVFSGVAFVLAMTGLLLVPSTIFRSLATGAILVGIVSVIAALTLLPALLSLLGDRVNALRIPVLGRSASAESRFWNAVVQRVLRRPVVSLVAGVGVLLALALPVLNLETGENGLRTFPDRLPSKQGFLAFEEEFGVGTVDSVEVVVDGDVSSEPVRAAITRLATEMRSEATLQQVSTELHPESRLAVIEAFGAGDTHDQAALDTVERLRTEVAPEAFSGVDAKVLVTGESAELLDYFDVTQRWLPIVITFVLGLSFLLLTVAFRSVVVALKAILLNLLSVGAAYGLLVLVFLEGIGNELFGFQQVETIEAWVPLFLFSVLFGLSMDYHVFLLSRIRERYMQTGDNDGAVAWGVTSTARLITGAALIIIAVFAGFARGDLVMFQQMGFGVAVSLFIDATLIRSVLVPAGMKLLGRWNWYLPSWLGWLPDPHVEGTRAPS